MEVEQAIEPARASGADADRHRARRSRCDGVVRRYGEREALRGVSLALAAGRRLPCSARTAPARRPSCAMLATLLSRTRERCACSARPPARRAPRAAARRLPVPRPAPLPGPVRPREPALLRAPLRRAGRRRAHRASARGDRHDASRGRAGRATSRAAWCSGWRSAARCCTGPSCCCSTSRARISTRRPPRWSSR